MSIYIPPALLEQVSKDSKVTVQFEFEGEVANSEVQNAKPPYLTFGLGLMIDSLNPQPVSTGEQLTISGIGFSNSIQNNEVFFQNEQGARVSADIVRASTSSIIVTVLKWLFYWVSPVLRR